jgi:hypothetical protein
MKRKHTEKKSANRCSGFSKSNGKMMSANREAKRIDLQPQLKRHFGLQVRRTQTITLERYIGVRRVVTKTIEHCYGSFDRT